MDNRPLGEAEQAAARFAESPLRDEVAVEMAAAAARADALLGRPQGAADAGVLVQEGAPGASGGAAEPELVRAPLSFGSSVLSGAGLGSLADTLMRESLAILEAVEAQQQRFEAAVLQQQVAAAASLPHRSGGRLAALLAGDGGGAPGGNGGGGHIAVAIIGGMPFRLVNLSPGAAMPVDLVATEDDEVTAMDPADSWALDEVLVIVLSAVCACTFVAFVRALVQLRALMLQSPVEDWDAVAYAELPGGGDAAAGGLAKLPPSMHSRRVSRRSGSGAGDEGVHVDERDLAGANVLVVVSHQQQAAGAGK